MNDSGVSRTMTLAALAERLWRFLCSVRLVLALILIITVVSLAGALIIQAPGEVLVNPLSYDRWVDGLRSRFGPFTGLFDFLGLFRVFRMWWFNVLVLLLMLNLIACTTNRFGAMWRMVRRPRVKVGQSFLERARYRSRFTALALSRAEASVVVVKALRRRRYRVNVIEDGDNSHIYADRNRYSRFGTFLTHGGIVLAAVAILWGNMMGFNDNGLVIPNDSVRAVGHGTNLSVLNEGFVEEYYPDGRPKDYRSDLVIYENGKEVKRQTVRVNEPMEYQGVRFHQSFFGNAAVMQVRDTAKNELLFADGVALAYRNESYGEARPVGFFTLFDGGLTIAVVGTAQDAVDNFIRPGEVVIVAYQTNNKTSLFNQKLVQGEPFEVAGLEVTFLREKQFTGLSVVKNPGVNLLWLATTFIVLGIYTVFYFPHRRVWVLCSQATPPSSLTIAGTAPRLSRFDGEFQRLVSVLEKELGTAAGSREEDVERGR